MIQVACPSCQASYDVDERRVPASGMRMRCPKCSASFMVSPNGSTALAPAPLAPPVGGAKGPPPAPPAGRPKLAPPLPGDAGGRAAPGLGELDLPAPKGTVGGMPDLDLPAPKASAPRAADFGELDLPAPKAAAPKPADFGELDLPAPKASAPRSADFGDLDLPAPKASAAKPADFGDLDLPVPKAAAGKAPALGDLDLPVPKVGASKAPGFGDLDLPVPKVGGPKGGDLGDLDLPAPKAGAALGGAFDIDLPVPRVVGGGLGDIDLPAPKGLELDLPAPKGRGGARGADLDLPAVKSGVELDLPAPKAGIPDLPAPKRSGGSLGDIDLPVAKAGVELDLPRPASGNIDLPAPKAGGLDLDLPKPKSGGLDLDLPAPKGGVDFGELDLGGGEGADELSLPTPRARPAASKAGGAGFGELDLDLGGGDGDELEFGGLSGTGGLELPALDDHAPIARDSMAGESLTIEEKKAMAAAARKKRFQRILAVTAAILVIGGGVGFSLKFTKLGPFGQYALERFLPTAGTPASATSAIRAAEARAVSDTFADARASLHGLASVRRNEGLNRALLTRSLVHESLYVVRFGADPSSASRATGIAARLAERSNDAPQMDLATAANALRLGRLAQAAGAVARARAGAASDPYVDLVAGEIALAQNQLAQAATAFRGALAHGGGARAQWGLARALLRANDAGATAAIDATLAASPKHVEARTALALQKLAAGELDAALPLARQAAGLDAVEGAPLHGSARSRAIALVVVGRVEELRSHRSDARYAYSSAAALDADNLDATVGTGRVLLDEGMAREALVRFDAAIQNGGTAPSVFAPNAPDAPAPRPLVAEARMGAVRALLLLERPAEAGAHITALRASLPDDPEVALLAGRVAHASHHEPEAEAAFRRAIELAPTSFEGYLALSQYFFDLDRPEDAGAALAAAEGKVQVTAQVRRLEGEAELRRNRLAEARAKFQAALELDPQDRAALFGLGVAMRRDGLFSDAASVLDRLGRLDASYPGLALERGQIYESTGQAELAVRMYERALREQPDDIDLQVRLGGAQVIAGHLDAAETTLSAALEARPTHATGIYFTGRLQIARGNYEEAIRKLQDAVRLESTRAEFHAWLAFANLERSELGAAQSEIARTLELDPQSVDGHLLNARLLARSGRVDEGLAEAAVAIQIDPRRTEVWAVVGECEEQRARRPQAVQAYRAALAGDPQRGDWWSRLARLQVDIGDMHGAVDSYRHAVDIGMARDPHPAWTAESLRGLGDSAAEVHDSATARDAYRRYLEIAPAGAPGRVEVELMMQRL